MGGGATTIEFFFQGALAVLGHGVTGPKAMAETVHAFAEGASTRRCLHGGAVESDRWTDESGPTPIEAHGRFLYGFLATAPWQLS